jgi:uncharacterized protein DUF5666
MLHLRARIAIAILAASVAASALSAAAQSSTTIEGTVASATATSATVATKMGSTTVTLTDKTRVIRRLPATLAEIKTGTFLAVTASKAADGSLTAVSVNIIDALKNARRGQWPMETGNIMTNMTVVSIVTGMAGRTIKLAEQDQTTTILVPEKTPIRRIELGKLTDLKAGMHVTVRGDNDGYGIITASSITIE